MKNMLVKLKTSLEEQNITDGGDRSSSGSHEPEEETLPDLPVGEYKRQVVVHYGVLRWDQSFVQQCSFSGLL